MPIDWKMLRQNEKKKKNKPQRKMQANHSAAVKQEEY